MVLLTASNMSTELHYSPLQIKYNSYTVLIEFRTDENALLIAKIPFYSS